ncbi:ParB/RepB/Spo0J family partition protein [Leptolyngbya sp. FACHB-671]|uniref:ParB/RepB/Spo0J family partition protein n=1 Tax=Leptolyngbya sp. FACHB-671 TaxID=2692812 RepID=UPI001686824C|nr:ParB/RepB/Spo0J family partition protein [Leptolyngbya sp. FACHB-671]MBD2067630.1 ParB/RepB/Spo0J family partition protein [Leptolyngbya sp. FACHB-671]
MAKSRQSLAQGLSASLAQKFIADPESTQSPQTVSIKQIQLPKRQPRRYFDPEKQEHLVRSVKEHGILEPLLVRPVSSGNYELVAGERRYRAACEVGLKDVPVVIREFDDRQAFQVALIENLQREDLNPIEETEGILELLAVEINSSTDEVASILHRANHAKKRGQELEGNVFLQFQTIESVLAGIGRFTPESFRTSRLPLLNLPAEVLKALREGKIEFTKARAIARVKDEQQRSELLQQAIAKNLSLSDIKTWIKDLKPESEQMPEKVLVQRWNEIGKRLQKDKTWGDRRKRDKITKLLDELDKLTATND